jgi:hypothetical protein
MKRSNIVLIVLVLVTLFLTGCSGGGAGKPQEYSVSGTIVDSNGNGIPDVTLGFGGSFGVAMTDDNGKWSKVGLNGDVTIAPVKDGWTFETRKVTKADSNVNFTGIKRIYPVVVTTMGEGKVNQEVAVSASSTQYEHGTQVQLTAVPETGWRFSHWEGDLEGSANPATISVDSEKSVTAVFVKSEYALNITVEGEGIVNEEVVVSAINNEYEHGTQVRLTAVPETGWRFSHWQGDLSGTANSIVVLVESAKNVKAVFTEVVYTLNTGVQSNIGGRIDVDPILEGYRYGTEVTITAVPEDGWAFDRWSGDLYGGQNPQTIVMDRSKNIGAVFKEARRLTITVVGNGKVLRNPDLEVYPDGRYISISAIPDTGWSFSHWEGDLSGTSSSTGVTLDQDMAVSAVFVEDQYTLKVTDNSRGRVIKNPDQPTYTHGTSVELTADPSDGYWFSHWNGLLSGNPSPIVVTISADTVVTATFRTVSKIAYSNTQRIFLMDSDGAYVTELTNGTNDSDPTWSPDGLRLAYVSYHDGNAEICVIDLEDRSIRRLTSNNVTDTSPSWSPDGTAIAFASDLAGSRELYVMDGNGDDLKRLTYLASNVEGPSWSPDGRRMAFSSSRDGKNELYVIDANGENLQKLGGIGNSSSSPVWSPDGQTIAFVGSDPYRNIYTMDVETGDIRKISQGRSYSEESWSPSWSPDGTGLLFSSQYPSRGIFIKDLQSGSLTKISSTYGQSLSWSPF